MTAAPGPSGGRGLVGTLINTTHARMQTSTPACPPTRLSARMHVRKRTHAHSHLPALFYFTLPALLYFTWHTSCCTCPPLPRRVRNLLSRLFTSVETWLQARG